jgi:type II secretion system protein L
MQIELLLDAQDVSMFDCQLPTLSRQRLRSVVEGLADDQLASGVSDVWLAFEIGLSGASSGVIGVRRDWFVLCLNVFATVGSVIWVSPDVLSLPGSDNSNDWVLWVDGQMCKIMTHRYRGFVLPIAAAREYLSTFLQQNSPAKISHIYVSDHATEVMQQWQADTLTFTQIADSEVAITYDFDPFIHRTSFNLLQDEFSIRRGGLFKNVWWRRSAYTWLMIVSMALGVVYWQARGLNQQMALIRSDIQQQARLVIPPQVPLLDPQAQLKALIKEPTQAQADPLLVLMQAADRLLQGQSGKITQLNYQAEQTRLTLKFEKAIAQEDQQRIERDAQQADVTVRWQNGRMEISMANSKTKQNNKAHALTAKQSGRAL